MFPAAHRRLSAHVTGHGRKRATSKVMLQLGMERDREYPSVPTAIEIVSDPEAKRIFEIAFVEQVMGRPFVLPPFCTEGSRGHFAPGIRCNDERPQVHRRSQQTKNGY